MYKRTVIVLWIPEIEDFKIFCVIELNSDDTAWKKTDIWSDVTNSGKAVGILETKFKNSLNNLGISSTKDCNWTYSKGISQVNMAAPTIINTENAIIVETGWVTPYVSIFCWRPTSKYATTILIIKGVKTSINKLNKIKLERIIKKNITVLDLVAIERAGDVIPYVTKLVKKNSKLTSKIKHPMNYPNCKHNIIK